MQSVMLGAKIDVRFAGSLRRNDPGGFQHMFSSDSYLYPDAMQPVMLGAQSVMLYAKQAVMFGAKTDVRFAGSLRSSKVFITCANPVISCSPSLLPSEEEIILF